MASTNKTTNYELSQFVGSDIPAWLSDYNGDMQKIDAGIHAAKEQAAGAASGVSILQTTVSGKQDTLNFDSAPIAGSTNPVTSGGIYNALQNVSVQTDAVPTAGSSKAVQSGGVYTALQGKQNTLTFDSTPTQGSNNPVTSGGVFAAIQSGSATQFNSAGTFSSRTGASKPRFRYLFNTANKSFLAMLGGDDLTFAGSAWVVASDALFPSTQKLYYIAGNPFNLNSNTKYPLTQTELLEAVTYSVGNCEVTNNNNEKATCFLQMLYVSDEDRTYIIGRMNYPSTTNQTVRSVIMFGDLGYSG